MNAADSLKKWTWLFSTYFRQFRDGGSINFESKTLFVFLTFEYLCDVLMGHHAPQEKKSPIFKLGSAISQKCKEGQ